MTYREATKQLRRVGTAHASGDAYRAMCAEMVSFRHGGKPERYYSALTGDDATVRQTMLTWMRDRVAAWDALMGLP